MGCCASIADTAVDAVLVPFEEGERERVWEEHGELAKLLLLSKGNLMKFYQKFKRANASKSGSLAEEELRAFLRQPESAFFSRVYSAFQDEHGRVPFKQFLINAWNFGAAAAPGIKLFAHMMYDSRKCGNLDAYDIQDLFQDVFGSNWEDSSVAAPIVAKFMEKNFKGQWVSRGVTSTIFARLTEGSGVLLMSVFKLQNTLQGALYDEGWWRTMIARRDNAFENGKMNFPRLLTIINEGRTRKGAYIQLNGMLMPLHTAAGTDESAVEKARRERSAPQKAIRKQFLDADRNSMLDQQHAVRREMESKARAALEAQLIPEEDFEASGPSLMRRAKSKAKAKGRTMAAGSKVQGAATVRPQQGPAIKATKVIKSGNARADALRAARARMT